MTFQVLDVPEDPEEFAPWLERHLLSDRLADFVAELEVVHSKTAAEPPPKLEAALSGHLDSVLNQGLGEVPRQTLAVLLRRPRLLFDLQERVLADGGAYWVRQLAAVDGQPDKADESWKRLDSLIRQDSKSRQRKGTSAAPSGERPNAVARPPRVGLIRAWAKCATIAASLMGFLYTVERLEPKEALAVPIEIPQPEPSAWGWNAPGLFESQLLAARYFADLADAANDWFDKRPDSVEGFAARLGELRTGCTRLIVAKHPGLSPEERKSLVKEGREWASKLDQVLHAVEEGKAVEEVRIEADAIVDRIVEYLRERSKAL